jgi:hypothetical protein
MSLEMPVLCDEDPTGSLFVERVGLIDMRASRRAQRAVWYL